MKLITDKLQNGLKNPMFTEYLQTPTPITKFTKEEIDQLQSTLESAIKTYPGLGIAAPQLGIKKRVCLLNVRDNVLFLVNPVITHRSEDNFLFYEGCLSIPKTQNNFICTIRSTEIKVQTDNLGEIEFKINPDGDKEQVSDETLLTVVAQHEIDHLDGITIQNRVYSTTIVKNTKYGRNEKVLMKSPTGEFVEVKYKKANEYFINGYEIV